MMFTNIYYHNKFNSLASKSLMSDFSYRSTAGITIAHAIVKSYATFTEMEMTRKEREFLENLLEENIDDDDTIVKVPTKNFKQIWEGTRLSIHNLDCGRFSIQELKIGNNGKEESLQGKSSFNIQR